MRKKKNYWETHWAKESLSFVLYKVLVRDKNLIVNPLLECSKEPLILYQTLVCESQESLEWLRQNNTWVFLDSGGV